MHASNSALRALSPFFPRLSPGRLPVLKVTSGSWVMPASVVMVLPDTHVIKIFGCTWKIFNTLDLSLCTFTLSMLSFVLSICYLFQILTHDTYCSSVHPGKGICCSPNFPRRNDGVSWEFFLLCCKGLRTEGVIYCTNCKASWEKCIIFLYRAI